MAVFTACPPERRDCKKYTRNRVNNNPIARICPSFRLPQSYNKITMSRWDSSTNRREDIMRHALYQIALLIAAFGLSGTLFSATLA